MVFTLDVGCGSRPMGDVNVDLLVEGDAPNIVNIRSISNFIVADARFLPFKNKTFTRVVCFHMMEHVKDDGLVYGEFNRVSNGEIEIRVPFGFWEDIINFIFFWDLFKEWRKKHHMRSYSKKNLKEALNNIFTHKNIVLSYGYVSFVQALRFAFCLAFKLWPRIEKINRDSWFPFPFPFEITAFISDG